MTDDRRDEEEAPRRARPVGEDEEGAKRLAERLTAGREPPAAATAAPATMASLTSDETRRLEATLSDLLECKRLLDSVALRAKRRLRRQYAVHIVRRVGVWRSLVAH